MGIYPSLNIFGIKIYKITDDIVNTVLFEIKCDTELGNDEKKEAYLFYESVQNDVTIQFQIYTECSSTYQEGVYMAWWPITLITFLEKFRPV